MSRSDPLDEAFVDESPAPATTWTQRALVGALVLLGTTLGSVAAWGVAQVTRPSLPEGVSWSSMETAFEPDNELPLDAAHTDVVVAIVCTFRKDRLQAYGNDRPTSPFLGRLGQAGVVFERAIVQAPWTRPSVGSLETGRWPGVLQLDDPETSGLSNRAVPDGFTSLAESMQAAGYHTIGASSNPNVNRLFGFAQGFDVYEEPDGLWRDVSVAAPNAQTLVRHFLAHVDETAPETRIFGRILVLDTHSPRYPSEQSFAVLKPFRNEASDGDADRLLEYEAALRTLDGQLGRLFTEMRARRPNLLFAVIGDHGEGLSFPHHHGYGHGNYLYRSTTEVPFLVYHPSLRKPGRHIRGLAMGIDLVPTVLDLLGLDLPAELDGESLADQVRGRQKEVRRKYAFSETWFRKSHKACVFDDHFHLIRDYQTLVDGQPAEELYAESDKLERSNVLSTNPAAVLRLRQALTGWEATVKKEAAEYGSPEDVTVGAKDLQRLKMLGYVE